MVTWSMLPLQLGLVLGSSWPGIFHKERIVSIIVPCGSHSSAGSWTHETSSQTFGWCTSFMTSMRTTGTFYFFPQENRIHRSVWVMCRINRACTEDIVLGTNDLISTFAVWWYPSRPIQTCGRGLCILRCLLLRGHICNAISFPSYDKL